MRRRPISPNAPGTDQKFRVTPHITDFLISEDPFDIVVKDQLGQVKYRVTRDDCFYDSQGRWYFTLEHVQEGCYEAIFTAYIQDDDYNKQRAVVVDRRLLTSAGRYTMPPRPKRTPRVEYEQVWAVSIDGEDYLADCDGRYVYTSDNKRIQFTNQLSNDIEETGKVKMQMTGEEFLRKWEGRSQNGEIDTVPELFDSMKGVSDDETVPEEVEQQIEDYMEEEAAENSDIDEMFS